MERIWEGGQKEMVKQGRIRESLAGGDRGGKGRVGQGERQIEEEKEEREEQDEENLKCSALGFGPLSW